MTDETRLNELLDRWEDLRQRGTAPSPESLCVDSPELADELRRRLEALGDVDAMLGDALGPTAEEIAAGAPAVPLSPPAIEPAVSRYRDLRFHARGGLGEVFRARDEILGRDVALKTIQARSARSADARRRFERESAITGRLEHPGVAPVHASGYCIDGRPYYVMRFIDGETLGDAIRQFHTKDVAGAVPSARTMAFRGLLNRFVQVCQTIGYAHGRGVLHRDIKPSNVMLGPHGNTLVVDWGLAKVLSEPGDAASEPSGSSGPDLTAAGSAVGTPAFMAPEQFDGDVETIGLASDVYSLGASLYCILTGLAPFDGDDLAAIRERVSRGEFPRPRSVRREVPPALEAVCLKAMALRTRDRYPSAASLAADVERWLADEPVTAWRETIPIRARRWMRRNRPAVAGAAVALVAGVVGLSALVALQSKANRELRIGRDKTTRALNAEMKANREAQAALIQKAEALAQLEESRKQSDVVTKFLVDAFGSPNPSFDGRSIKVVDVLDRAAKTLYEGSDVTPLTRETVRDAGNDLSRPGNLRSIRRDAQHVHRTA